MTENTSEKTAVSIQGNKGATTKGEREFPDNVASLLCIDVSDCNCLR